MGVDITIDLDYDEIVDACSRRDKKHLLRELIRKMTDEDIREVHGDIKDEETKAKTIYFVMPWPSGQTIIEREFHESLLTISRSYRQVTLEEETTINNIAKRFK